MTDDDAWRCPGCGTVTDDPRLHVNGYTFIGKNGQLVDVEGCSLVDGTGSPITGIEPRD